MNFYSKSEPLLAVGSLSHVSMPPHCVWRYYLDDQDAGVAADISIAEAHLRKAIARGQDLKPGLF